MRCLFDLLFFYSMLKTETNDVHLKELSKTFEMKHTRNLWLHLFGNESPQNSEQKLLIIIEWKFYTTTNEHMFAKKVEVSIDIDRFEWFICWSIGHLLSFNLKKIEKIPNKISMARAQNLNPPLFFTNLSHKTSLYSSGKKSKNVFRFFEFR